jgi:hypothetical protein
MGTLNQVAKLRSLSTVPGASGGGGGGGGTLLPDVTTQSFTAPGSGTKGGSISVSFTVINIGTGSSDALNPPGSTFDVAFYLSKDNQFSPGTDYLLNTYTFNALAAGASASAGSTLSLPVSWSGYTAAPVNSSFYVLMVIDPDQTMNEVAGGTANNIASSTITIT